MLVYIEYMSRRPSVPLDAFHSIVSRGQSAWEASYTEDRLLLNLARTWRLGPEPEYMDVWYHPTAGLERVADWEQIVRSGDVDSLEESFTLAARVDRAGCYEPLIEPIAGAGGPYYAEFIDFSPGASPDDVRAFYKERRKKNRLDLNLLVDAIGKLAPEPRGLAVWQLPDYPALAPVARELEDGDFPVRLITAGLYTDIGKEEL